MPRLQNAGPVDGVSTPLSSQDSLKVFEEDKAKSRLMTRSEFKNRSLCGKILDKIVGLFRGQL
jgi:hypothetical protein